MVDTKADRRLSRPTRQVGGRMLFILDRRCSIGTFNLRHTTSAWDDEELMKHQDLGQRGSGQQRGESVVPPFGPIASGRFRQGARRVPGPVPCLPRPGGFGHVALDRQRAGPQDAGCEVERERRDCQMAPERDGPYTTSGMMCDWLAFIFAYPVQRQTKIYTVQLSLRATRPARCRPMPGQEHPESTVVPAACQPILLP